MALHKVGKGLDLPLAGQPEQRIEEARPVQSVAVVAADYVGLRPSMLVNAGDAVKRGQPLFEDKKNPGVPYTAPGAGRVAAINRGERRALVSLVIDLDDAERAGNCTHDAHVRFSAYTGKALAGLTRDEIKALLIESGLWVAFRTRPFSKVPSPDSKPHALFVTAMDTQPHAPSVEVVLQGREADFDEGLVCLKKLVDGDVFLCKAHGVAVPVNPNTGIVVEEFMGPHPAGTPGLHIHTLCPAGRNRTLWHIHYTDVVAIGHLFRTGMLDLGRVAALGGPAVKKPRLLHTRMGASTDDLVAGELDDGDIRVISGSVLAGRAAMGAVEGYLGRYHHQVAALREGHDREFLGWAMPGFNKYSVLRAFASALLGKRAFALTTSTSGSQRAIVPFGTYERVMPMDIMPTFLLRALASGDIERSEHLGCLELDEEDLALCSFVCPGKNDFGPTLRAMLDTIEKEG